jgi:radical SAM superfamily enzyme YgiQ (UPF0313 family)
MKVLFVYPDINVRGGALSYPFGIGQLSAWLKRHGHETRLHSVFGRYDASGLRRAVAEFAPDVVGFSVVYPQWRFVKRLLADLRPWKALTVCGGAHPTVQPACIEEAPDLNAVCVGEGEEPLLDLLAALAAGKSAEGIAGLWVRRSDGTVARNPARPFFADLDRLPPMDRGICDYQAVIDSDYRTATFQFGRGCPFNCSYCSNHVLRTRQEGSYVRFPSVDKALAEIRAVTSRYRSHYLYLNDDTFLVKKAWFEEFCERYPKEFGFPIFVNARPEQIDEDVCRRLAAARCQRVTMGIEHGNEEFRRKVLRRGMSNEGIAQAFALCRRYGFRTKAHFLVGLPGETPELHADSVRLAARIRPDSFNLHIFEPYPGTTLGDVCWKENLIDPERAGKEFVGQTDTVLRLPQFPRRLILRAFRRFAFRVYRRESLWKAVPYRIYYSRWGEALIRGLHPIKRLVRKWAMGV